MLNFSNIFASFPRYLFRYSPTSSASGDASASTSASTAPARVGRQMTITDLRIHPIKSCRGISLKSAYLSRQGLRHDRQWMFVDASRKFITIRDQSELTLVKTALDLDDGSLLVTLPERKESGLEAVTLRVPLDPTVPWLEANCEKLDVEIWGIGTDGWTYTDPSIHTPITEYFRSVQPGSDVKLVMKGPSARTVAGNGAKEHLGRTETINFPDIMPIQVASEVSLAELNERLQQKSVGPITIERFRPNIVVNSDDLTPWEEDEWKLLRVNPPASLVQSVSSATGIASHSIDLDVTCRCARCQVPNVDPDTAAKHPKEPWTTLVNYRRVDEGIKFKPCFGMLCCPRNEGRIEVGMRIEVTAVMAAAGGKGEHKYIKGF